MGVFIIRTCKKNLSKTGINQENIIYIQGLVEQTLQKKRPEKISLLRLDTDFYETKTELEIPLPISSRGWNNNNR